MSAPGPAALAERRAGFDTLLGARRGLPASAQDGRDAATRTQWLLHRLAHGPDRARAAAELAGEVELTVGAAARRDAWTLCINLKLGFGAGRASVRDDALGRAARTARLDVETWLTATVAPADEHALAAHARHVYADAYQRQLLGLARAHKADLAGALIGTVEYAWLLHDHARRHVSGPHHQLTDRHLRALLAAYWEDLTGLAGTRAATARAREHLHAVLVRLAAQPGPHPG